MALFIMLNFILPNCSGNCQDGYGTYKWKSGAVYEGDWKNDEKSTTYFKPLKTIKPRNSF